MNNTAETTAYAFRLDAFQNGFLYYRAVSGWAGQFAEHGRDVRRPEPVITKSFQHIMELLGQPFRWIRDDTGLASASREFGWMLIPIEFAQARLASLLESRKCVKSAIGLFWDERLPRKRACSRRIPKDVRQKVLARDGNRCIECGKGEADGIQLTMDHVIPFSSGGETTEGNLVTLCEACNQGHGNAAHPHLFALAGLHSGWDKELLKAELTSDTACYASMLSQNIMVSQCRASAANGTLLLAGQE